MTNRLLFARRDDHDDKIGKALQRLDIANIGYPKRIGHLDIELAINCMVDDTRRLAAIVTKTTLLADFRLDISKFCLSCNAARTAPRTLFTQIIMQLLITEGFAATRPRVTEGFGLSVIFLYPIADRSLLPRIVAARMYLQIHAHAPNGKLAPMLGEKHASHLFGKVVGPMAGLCLTSGEISCSIFRMSRT